MNLDNILQEFSKGFKTISHQLDVKFVKFRQMILLNAYNVRRHFARNVTMIKKMKINFVKTTAKE